MKKNNWKSIEIGKEGIDNYFLKVIYEDHIEFTPWLKDDKKWWCQELKRVKMKPSDFPPDSDLYHLECEEF